MNNTHKSVAVISAGPVGMAAAAHLIEKGLKPVIFEKGNTVGHAVSSWGHVKVFTPWKYIYDKALLTFLEQTDWKRPDAEYLPYGSEIVKSVFNSCF